MKFDLFFAGMENKETWASAWLATMLRDDATFRRAFFEKVHVDPPLDPGEQWNVLVETALGSIGACDVTLAGEATYMFIENKVSRSAIRPGQFGGYYRGVTEDQAAGALSRAIGIFLAPDRAIGAARIPEISESSLVATRRASGHADDAISLSWKDDLQAITDAVDPGNEFAHEGLRAILAHIKKIDTTRPFNQQREDLRQLMARVSRSVKAEGDRTGERALNVHFERWPIHGGEALYTPHQAITSWLQLRYRETDDEQSEVVDVYVDGEVHVRASVAFNPSTKTGLRDPALMARWNDLVAHKAVNVDGVEMPARDELGFELAREFRGSEAQLEDLLVPWGISVLRFAMRLASTPEAPSA